MVASDDNFFVTPAKSAMLFTPTSRFITTFVTLFAVVIAVTKDLPDVEGDRQNGIETFATRLGVRNTSLAGKLLTCAGYVQTTCSNIM